MEDERKRYGALKIKIREQNSILEQENIDLRDQIDGKDRELKKIRREFDKLKREAAMLKEEMSILGHQEKKAKQ